MKVQKGADLSDEYLALVARHVISQINSDSFEITDDNWTNLDHMLLDKTASGIVPTKSFFNTTQVEVKSGQVKTFLNLSINLTP